MSFKGVGIHVFAGGFTMGVQEVMSVETQLEVHGFGMETANTHCGVNVINCPAKDWPHIEADFAFGNPRCTGFSTITSGYDSRVHGPWSAVTSDIHEFVDYSLGRYPIFIWESVQQAYSTGKPLLDYLVEKVSAQGYRVAHLFINASSLGNSQQRKRYFFVAYKGDKPFNIDPPRLPQFRPTVYDAIWDMRNRETVEKKLDEEETFDTYSRLTNDEKQVLPRLPNGWCLNRLARYSYDDLTDRQKAVWNYRKSDIPFSLHGISRLHWTAQSPTLFSSSNRLIHPDLDRPLTLGELSTIMGWNGRIPVGENKVGQLVKGVCPCVGEWLATQAHHYLNDNWGGEDFETSFDDNAATWVGADSHGKVEKVFNLNRFTSKRIRDDFPFDDFRFHRFNVDERTGRIIKPWSQVAKSYRQHN